MMSSKDAVTNTVAIIVWPPDGAVVQMRLNNKPFKAAVCTIFTDVKRETRIYKPNNYLSALLGSFDWILEKPSGKRCPEWSEYSNIYRIWRSEAVTVGYGISKKSLSLSFV